jgi:hypothetical protein
MSMPAELAAQIQRTPSPTRSQLSSRTAIAVAVGLVATVTILVRHGVRPGAREPFFMAAVAFIMLSFAARTLFAAMGSLWTSPRGTQRLVVMPFVLLAAVAIAYGQGPGQAHSLRGDLPCVLMTLAIGGIVGAAIFFARRATEPLRPTLKGLLLASFSAAVAGSAVFLACPLAETWHFAIGHLGGAMLVGGLLGASGARVMRA